MIKEVSINYPTFGLDINRKFTKGINIIEERNSWGKTSICNTIMSVYTNKYQGLKTLPDGTATVVTDKDRYVLSKNKWIGVTHEPNDLYKYCMPGKFFEGLSTPQQRSILIDLLDLNFNKYMEKECKKIGLVWQEDLEKKLKSSLKENTDKSNMLSEDIMRLRSQLINFDKKDFSDIDKFYEDQKIIISKIKEHNKSIIDRQLNYNNLCSRINNYNSLLNNININIENKQRLIESLEKQLEGLRYTYNKSSNEVLCDKCGSPLQGDNKQKFLDGIVNNANEIKDSINNYKLEIEDLVKQKDSIIERLNELNKDKDSFNTNFELLNEDDIVENAKLFGIDFKGISESRMQEYDDYKKLIAGQEQILNELRYKENQLKDIDILKIQSDIDKISELKSKFTTKLQKATKELPLNIELFKTLKNGNITETFTINHNGIDYYDLSSANKLIVNVMLAKIFVDKLGLDFILLDEASIISKDNLSYIKELGNDYQVILTKATGWSKKDLL